MTELFLIELCIILSTYCIAIIACMSESTGTKQHCDGPFNIRLPQNFSADQLSEADSGLLQSCMQMCVRDLCCKSFGLRNGRCTTSPLAEFPLDFINEVGSFLNDVM